MTMSDKQLTEQILQQRAQNLAKTIGSAQAEPQLHVTLFSIHQQQFAIATAYVFATVAPQAVTPVPMQPALLLGICSALGQIVPVIDLAELLQLPGNAAPAGHYLLLGEQQAELALAVSQVSGQHAVAASIPPEQQTNDNPLIQAILPTSAANTSLTLLCGKALLSDSRLFFSL